MRWIHSGVRLFLHIFWLFPIRKNRIIFTAYRGAQFSCNPKYIFLEMYAKHKEKYDFIWCLNDPTQLPHEFENVKIVPYKSLKYIYFQITSKVVILNHANPVYIPLRKKQLKINTWHGGGAYKKVRLAANGLDYKYDAYKSRFEIKDTSYIISACERFTEVMSQSLMLPKSIFLNSGMPRNDMFFESSDKLIKHIKEKFKIKNNQKIVLYAPTYKGKQLSKELDIKIDVASVLKALKRRFEGEWVFFLRTHLDTIHSTNNDVVIKDVTSYSDMQELLLISDVLITDYSSSIWDFSLTNKPGFLFTPDFKSYDDNRGLYTPIDEWQYPYSDTNEKLIIEIENYSQKQSQKRIFKHLKTLGSFEKGLATIRLCEKIESAIL